MTDQYKEEIQKVEKILSSSCAQKVNVLKPYKEKGIQCPCTTHSMTQDAVVDLIVLIDTSGSMSTKASNISKVAQQAIQEAQKKCPTDLRVEWLGVHRTWPGTQFTVSHKDYIDNLSLSPSPVFFSDPHPEEGADACAELAKYFNWREGACRAILYLSDESLDRGDPHSTADDLATQNSITVCKDHNVSVFTHLVGGLGNENDSNIVDNYKNLASQTGGKYTIGGLGTQQQYLEILKDVICNACGGCTNISVPDIKPCISIFWGDSKCDCLETDDFEILCISVCNCYSNISFDQFYISSIEVTDGQGQAVAKLPDGTPSIQAVPIGPICFGDIPPCTDGNASCIHREFVLHTRGAKDGDYQVKLHGIYFDVTFRYKKESCFELKLCQS